MINTKNTINFTHKEIPCFYDDRDKGWGGVKTSDFCPTQRANRGGIKIIMGKENEKIDKIEADDFSFRIRRLTPKECWRLMGLTFEDCGKAFDIGISDTQLYKQAGNGIITNCCELLAEHLYKAQYDNAYKCTDEIYTENFINPQAELTSNSLFAV